MPDAPAADAAGSAGDAPATDGPAGEQAERVEADLDQLTAELAGLHAERDEYLDSLRRVQADFENYRKRMARQQVEQVERASERLVVKLLPVLDTVDLAEAHSGGAEAHSGGGPLAAPEAEAPGEGGAAGADDGEAGTAGAAAEPVGGREPAGRDSLARVASLLREVLQKEGLERVEPLGAAFDPEEHEAVVHEPGEGPEPEVIEVMRAGYRYKGRLLRAALVKVKG
ncbi:MAG: nucleotide exchange factor GrpE [Acidimicrobiales bacterium]